MTFSADKASAEVRKAKRRHQVSLKTGALGRGGQDEDTPEGGAREDRNTSPPPASREASEKLANIADLQEAQVVKNPPAHARDAREADLIPGSGRSPWRRKWKPTVVFLPGKFHGQSRPVGYSSWGPKEDTTEYAHSTPN